MLWCICLTWHVYGGSHFYVTLNLRDRRSVQFTRFLELSFAHNIVWLIWFCDDWLWTVPNDVFRDSKDFVDGVDDAVSGVLVQFLQRTIFKLDARSCVNCSNQTEADLNSGGVVSLCDDVVLFLVLLRVDCRSGEGFVRVPDQTQRVDSSFHLV